MYGLFYNRTATIYTPTRDETTMISWWKEKATIKCALQCLYWDDQWERRGRELNRVYRAYRFFSDYLDVQIGDTAIAKSAARGNRSYQLATGQSLF